MRKDINSKRFPKKKKSQLLRKILPLFLLLAFPCHSQAQQGLDFFGENKNIQLDNKTKAPAIEMGDPFGAELYIDGRTDVALDANSLAAKNYAQSRNIPYPGNDASVRNDITTGQIVGVYIAPEHYVQLSFLKDNEIVYPIRAYPAQPKLLEIRSDPNSPFIYIASAVRLEGQTTNLLVETEEDGTIQTYVIDLIVTEPKNIRPQVSINLVSDRTPPIRNQNGASSLTPTNSAIPMNRMPSQQGIPDAKGTTGPTLGSVYQKFTRDDIKRFFNTMIEMANRYGEAKQIEKQTGRIIYRENEIIPAPGGKISYIDPIDGCQWAVQQVWFFPKYDAILLNVTCYNPRSSPSSWDYAMMKWKALDRENPVEKGAQILNTTAAAPFAIQTLGQNTNQIQFLIQGERIDPMAEFVPIFPRENRRSNNSNYQPSNSNTAK